MSQIAKTVLPLVACLFTTGKNLRAIDDYDFLKKKSAQFLSNIVINATQRNLKKKINSKATYD